MKKDKSNNIVLPKGFVISNEIESNYDNQPLFISKVEKTNLILKTVGIPKFHK